MVKYWSMTQRRTLRLWRVLGVQTAMDDDEFDQFTIGTANIAYGILFLTLAIIGLVVWLIVNIWK